MTGSSAAFDSDDDADLRRAIALSLEQPGQGNDPVELSSDEDDDDLEKPPVYRRKVEENAQPDAVKTIPAPPARAPSQPALTGHSGPAGLAGFDRKKMEEERLSRLAKRKAPDSEQEPHGRQNRARTGPAPNMVRPETNAWGKGARDSGKLAGVSTGSPLFPKGVVKKTWASGYPRTGDDIKIEEVLQKDGLELAVLSSYQWDEEWMLSKIDINRTKIVCIAYASSKEQQEEMTKNVPPGAIRFCFPSMLPMGNMHSKLQLLKYSKYLRIVVPSGNLISYDWGETGVMENIVFIIDLPLIENPEVRAASQLNSFGEDLSYFLRAQSLDENLVRSLSKYDFSETSRYAFVHTIGKSHVGNDSWKRTGYCGLGRAVSNLGLNSSVDIELDYVVSSLGSVNAELVSAIYYAAQGNDGLKEYQERTAKVPKGKPASARDIMSAKLNDRFRVYFPSHDTVSESRGGKKSAGTISAQSKWWNSDKFPRQLIHDCKNVRSGLLMHSKMMLIRSTKHEKKPSAWAYIGSANLSESAWGRLTKDKKTGNPKLTCRNWECGVVVPVTGASGDSQVSASQEARNDLSVFRGCIPVPIIWPSEPYGKTGSKQPWLFLEN
ncbi:ubiquitin interaction domain-containing protein [Xylariales sp. AK1849]|nr:ubiquitin interaction domain-containing protein [Xylariales sp. AK1849]